MNRYIYRKRKYHLLSYMAPTYCLRWKSRRGYLACVAAELARGRFLDIGCGAGIATSLYGRLKGSLSVGVDRWGEMLSLARTEARRHRSPAIFVQADAGSLPFPDASFDTVYLGQILEHLDSIEGTLQEADRLVRPGGLLVVSVPDRDLIPSEGHVRTFDARSLREIFAERWYGEIRLHPYDDRRLVCSGVKPAAEAS